MSTPYLTSRPQTATAVENNNSNILKTYRSIKTIIMNIVLEKSEVFILNYIVIINKFTRLNLLYHKFIVS